MVRIGGLLAAPSRGSISTCSACSRRPPPHEDLQVVRRSPRATSRASRARPRVTPRSMTSAAITSTRSEPASIPIDGGVATPTSSATALGGQSRSDDLVSALDAIVWEADGDDYRMTFVSPRSMDIAGYPPRTGCTSRSSGRSTCIRTIATAPSRRPTPRSGRSTASASSTGSWSRAASTAGSRMSSASSARPTARVTASSA